MVKYNDVELEIIRFTTEDVITTSCTGGVGCDGQDDDV